MNRRGQLGLFTGQVEQPPPAPEFHVHCMIADTLRRFADREWRYTHIPLGEYRHPATAARLARMGVIAGWPDFILLSPIGAPHFIEVKRRKSGRLSDDQQDFAEWCAAHCVPHVIVKRYGEALDILTEWGVIRTKMRISA